MYRNILIISNSTCNYHFTCDRKTTFELCYNSDLEFSLPSDSPANCVFRAIAFSMHNAKEPLQKICEGKIRQKIYDKLYVLPINSIDTIYHDENNATVHIAGHKPDKSIEHEYYDLKMKNGEWIITAYRIE